MFVCFPHLQYILLPFFIKDTFSAVLLSNTVYMVAWLAYAYITVLGYMGTVVPFLAGQPCPLLKSPPLLRPAVLPFLHKTSLLLVPVFGLVVVYLLAVIFQVNMTAVGLHWFLGT